MAMAETVDWYGKPSLGYVVNTEFSDENASQLMDPIGYLQSELGSAIACPPRDSLHITLMDWIAPLLDYDGQDKRALYNQVRSEYSSVLTEAVAAVGPINVHFDTIVAAPTTIFVQGHDDGSFQKIRDYFVKHVELLPHTKQPPNIIHSSLARFVEPIDIDMVQRCVGQRKIDFVQQVTQFRLVKTTKEPILEFETLQTFDVTQ